MQHLLDDLNGQQRRAVQHEGGALLVVAGAGSGKTRVITRRIAWLLASGVPERAILGVTFTNKAAREMAERVRILLPESRARVSTFHSACAAFLRRSGHLLGFGPGFTIYDTTDRDDLIRRLMKERDIDVKQIRPAAVGAMISRLKNEGIGAEEYEPRPWIPVQRVLGEVYGQYQDALSEANAMDFDDLLLHFRRILDENEDERQHYADRFRHVLVDEFQDTNPIQYEIVKRLTEKHGNICVVGDPDQSIYSFRGAEIGNIMSFPQDFPGTTVIKLETNYRSTSTILEFAQKCISFNEYRYEKTLRPYLGEGSAVDYVRCDSGREEARQVGYRIRLLLENGTTPSEIAVFYRARFLSRALEEVLRMLGIPYDLIGDVGFFARKEIRDLCAFLQVCVNPKDTVSLFRILNVPSRGIGKVSEERIAAESKRRGLGPAELVLSSDPVPGVSGKAAAGMMELAGLLAEGQLLAGDSVERTLRLFLDRTGYREFLREGGTRLDVERDENILELLGNAHAFDREHVRRGERSGRSEHAVARYLQDVSLLADTDEQGDEEAVQLMTIHSAKGLEFDHVFLVGLEQGIFPHSQRLERQEDLEEERRLFYVASTRARQTLTVLRAEMRQAFDSGAARPRSGQPSQFLYETDLETRRRDYGASLYDESGERVYRYDEGDGEDPEPDATGSFEPGDLVRHRDYGDGKILRCFGRGRSAKVEVLFPAGVRVLLLEYARLDRMEER